MDEENSGYLHGWRMKISPIDDWNPISNKDIEEILAAVKPISGRFLLSLLKKETQKENVSNE